MFMMTSNIVEVDDDANDVEGGDDAIDVHDDDYELHTMLLMTRMRLFLRIMT
jgi:hypothetical protein